MRSTPNVTFPDHLLPSRVLPSWVDDHTSECCEWERVTCNSTTGHVTHISLHNIWEFDIEPDYYSFYSVLFKDMVWFLNVSLFESFKELRSLDLSSNAIGGWIEHKGMLIYIISLFLIICNDCNLSYVNISFGQQIDRHRRKNKTQKIVIFSPPLSYIGLSSSVHWPLLIQPLYLVIYLFMCMCVCLLTPKFFFWIWMHSLSCYVLFY